MKLSHFPNENMIGHSSASGSGGSQWLGELDFLERVLQATRARVTNTHVG